MSKKITYSIWIILVALSVASILISLYSPKKVVVVQEPNFDSFTPYTDNISWSKCPDDASVGDRFYCINDLAVVVTTEADTLADELIARAPIRLKEISATKTGPMSWEYGGEIFLKDLPEIVKGAQNSKEQYLDNVCNLSSMKIMGSTGMDIEKEACIYYHTEQYLKILESLEKGVNE